MPGSAGTPLLPLALLTVFAKIRQRLSEYLEAVKPYVAELILIDISLNKLRSFLNIKAGCNIAVDSDCRSVCSGTAVEEPISYFSFEFKA